MLGLKDKKTSYATNVNMGFSRAFDNPIKKSSLSLMVVEDDNDVRELICFMLKNKGYRIVSFDNAITALKYLESNMVDFIISDVVMPDMDGFNFCSKVKEKYPQLYFILLTAKSNKTDITNGLTIGADDYIVKPFDFMEFLARVEAGERVIQNQKELTFLNEKLEKLADTDGLTRLNNRRFLFIEGERELKRATRYNHTIAAFMIDIDHFKNINDTYGHQAGDYILKRVGKLLTSTFRESDIICRYGGEEFVTILPETNPKLAFRSAEKIRKVIEKETFNFEGNEIKLTISVGVAIKTPDMNIDLKKLIGYADKGLYSAKAQGRNKSVLYKSFKITNLEKVTL